MNADVDGCSLNCPFSTVLQIMGGTLFERRKFRVSFLFAFLALYAFLLTPLFSYSQEEYWQEAASLIQKSDFSNALKVTDKLLAQRPDDVLLLRMKAICLLELGDENRAVQILRQAITIDPASVSCRYYLAQALAYSGNVIEARKLLNEVIEQASDSEYARMAQNVLPKLDNLAASVEALPQGRRWNFSTRMAEEYDDNVPARSSHEKDTTPTESFQFSASAFLEVRLLDEKIEASPFTAGMSYAGYQSLHDRKSLNDLDVTSHAPSIFIEKNSVLKSIPWKARVAADYTNTELGFAPFSDSAGLKTNFEFQWSSWAVFAPHYSAELRYFKEDTLTPQFYSRDGLGQTAGFDQQFYLFNNKVFVSVGYNFQWDNTQGILFEINSHNASGSLGISLPWKLRLNTQLEYHTEDYNKFTFTPQRLDNLYTLSASLSRPVWKESLILELTYTYNTSNSNYNFAEYERSIYGIALNYNF